MYRVPSEFIRQKTTIFGPITVAHAAGALGGYLLAQVVSDSAWVKLLCAALGLVLTTVTVKGLVLYQFLPLAAVYLYRRLVDDSFEPDAQADAVLTPPAMALVIRDEEGRPIIFQEE